MDTTYDILDLAGLVGSAIVLDPAGRVVSGRESLTPEQNAALDAAIAAYDPLDEVIAAKSVAIQAEKCRVRDAGFLVGGIRFDSDQAARTSYLELADMLAADASYVTPWKASPGAWVDMNAALYAKVKAAGAAHISSCFAWQGARDAELQTIRTSLAAGTMSHPDAIAAVNAVSAVWSIS